MGARCCRRSGLVLLLTAMFFVVLLPSVGQAQGVPYQAGPYTVKVDVRTSLMLIIPHAYVKCRLSGGRIRVSASAPGYVAAEREIPVTATTQLYYAELILRDKPKRLDVSTFDYKPIASAYFERDQSGTPTDKYAINLFLPIRSWPHPSPENIFVNQPGYGIPIEESCEISVREDFYRVRMLINRAFLDDPHDELLVYVNTDQIIDRVSARRWFALIRQLERGDPAGAADLANVLVRSLPPDLPGSIVPVSVTRLLELRRRFEELHRSPSR